MITQERISVAVYMRVSSDDQRDRETIKTQQESIERFLGNNHEYFVYRWYADDGVSGTVPMAKRPQGGQMVADARAGKFSKIVVYRASRLGREEEDQFAVYNLFVEALDIELVGVMEPLNDRLIFGFHTVMNAQYRRQFAADSARGMDRAAREGRYTGGIVPLGYRVEGFKHTARLVPDESLVWGNWTAVRLVRRIYEWLALDHKSCRWIAQELNRLGVPTAYSRDGRGVRGSNTQAIWRPGRIRNLVVSPVYRGVLAYGRRRSVKSKRTEVIEAAVEAIVPDDLWYAAQQVLLDNRIISKRNTETVYLLRSVIKCGLCGLTFCGAQGRPGVWWYRCNGYLAERGGKDKRCAARSIRNTDIEPIIWKDIELLLRNPGDLLDELCSEADGAVDEATVVADAERITLHAALDELEPRRQRNLDVFERGRLSLEELDQRLQQIDDERRTLQARLDAISPPPEAVEAPVQRDLLEEIRSRLDAGLSDEQRSEIVRLLVKRITVYTTPRANGRKDVRLLIEYRFPDPRCSQNRNGTDSWLQRA